MNIGLADALLLLLVGILIGIMIGWWLFGRVNNI